MTLKNGQKYFMDLSRKGEDEEEKICNYSDYCKKSYKLHNLEEFALLLLLFFVNLINQFFLF